MKKLKELETTENNVSIVRQITFQHPFQKRVLCFFEFYEFFLNSKVTKFLI